MKLSNKSWTNAIFYVQIAIEKFILMKKED